MNSFSFGASFLAFRAISSSADPATSLQGRNLAKSHVGASPARHVTPPCHPTTTTPSHHIFEPTMR
jgi:hypothetical protein